MMVDPDFRGHQIAELMAKKRVDTARDFTLTEFWIECVTNHPYSQHKMIAFDAKETGLFIGDFPTTISMRSLKNHANTKMSLFSAFFNRRAQ